MPKRQSAVRRRQAKSARQQAEAANRTKDEFPAMLGHELRNPLAPIRSALELMSSRQGDPEHEVVVIRRQVDHLVGLVDELLDVKPRQRTTPERPSPPQRILVVDDNQDACELLALLLTREGHEGHEVFNANDGSSALAIAAQNKPAVALLDIGLQAWPGMNWARSCENFPSSQVST